MHATILVWPTLFVLHARLGLCLEKKNCFVYSRKGLTCDWPSQLWESYVLIWDVEMNEKDFGWFLSWSILKWHVWIRSQGCRLVLFLFQEQWSFSEWYRGSLASLRDDYVCVERVKFSHSFMEVDAYFS